jgi:hypothetical protein
VTKDIMRFFATSKSKAGSAFNQNGFTLRVMMHYTPEQKASFADSMKELVEVGNLVEEREGTFYLTEEGAAHIKPEPTDMSRGQGKRNFRR